MATNAFFANQYKLTTLSVAGGIDDSQTTGIVVQDITGVEATKPGIAAFTYSDPIDTTKIEYISYTSINTGTKALVGVTRGVDGSTAKAHLNGATVALSIISESHINNLATALIIGGSATNLTEGVLDEDTMASDSATKLATQQSIKAYSDLHGIGMTRQALINGNFDVWQRGTSITNNGSSIIYTADRWGVFNNSSTNADSTISRQTASVNKSQYGLRIARDESATYASSIKLFQALESVNSIKLRGSKLTLSFYLKVGANYTGGDIAVSIYSGTGTDEQLPTTFTGAAAVGSQTITPTTTATKYTITTTNVIADTVTQLGVYLTTNNFSGTAGANDWLQIEQVQLCAGDVALPFQPKSFGEELVLCKRYFERIAPAVAYQNLANGFNSSTTVGIYNLNYQEKRTIPSITSTGNTTFGINHVGDTATQSTAISFGGGASRVSTKMARMDVTVASGLTAGQGSMAIAWTPAASTYIDISAEL